MAEKIVHGGEVEIQLPGIFRLEWPHFEINDDKASELEVVKQQIDFEVLSSYFKQDLAADEGEPDTKLDEELAQVGEKFPLQVALVRFGCEGEKIEVVRVFDDLLREIGLRLGEGRLEVCKKFVSAFPWRR